MVRFAEQVTIIVPTLNRSHFVNKMLRYLDRADFGGVLIIADSSNDEHFGRTKSEIESLSPGFEVDHRPYPGLRVFECLRETAPAVTTPYVLFFGDDDFPIPEGLEECTKFLTANKEYSAAGGTIIGVNLGSPNFEKVIGTWHCRINDVVEDTASQRLESLLSDYRTSAYSVSRTSQFVQRTLLDEGRIIPQGPFSDEMINACLLVLQGKVKFLDRLLFVRQFHGQQAFSDLFDWITSSEFYPSHEIFRERLSMELVSQDGIDTDAANQVVKQAFWHYLSQAINRMERNRGDVRTLVARLHFLRWAWRHGRSLLPGTSNQITLSALLRPGSRFHSEFMPIYRIITSSN